MWRTKLPFKHPNCGPHNRLVYELNYEFLARNKARIKGNIIDLGCGERPYEEWLLQYGNTYLGVDWSETLHALRADIVADLSKPLPLDDNVADTVVSFSVLEHLFRPQQLLAEAYRLLRPGGSLLLQVPFMWGVHEAPHDYYRFTPYALTSMGREANFDEVIVSPQGGYWTAATLKANYQLRRLIRGPKPLNWLTGACAKAVWTVDQPLARVLDKCWPSESESIGHCVVATKL